MDIRTTKSTTVGYEDLLPTDQDLIHYFDKARENAIRHRDQLTDSIDKYDDGSPVRNREEILSISLPKKRDLNYMNPWSRSLWVKYLNEAFECVSPIMANPRMITAIHHPWHTDDRSWELDVRRIKRKIWKELRGLSYIGMIEFAYFTNIRQGHGRLITPHFQGILFNEMDRSKSDQVHAGFAGGIFGAVGFYQRKISNFLGALNYSVKQPAYGNEVFQRKDGSFGRYSKKLWLTQHYKLYRHLNHFSFPDLTMSAGEGVKVLALARKFGSFNCSNLSHI